MKMNWKAFLTGIVIVSFTSFKSQSIENKEILKPFVEKLNQEKITQILESARLAPSGSNTQPWIFIVVKSEETKKKLTVNIIEDNYILSQYLDFNHMLGGNAEPKKYDFVIGNPPYMKIPKDAPEATAMPEVCYGAPNLYFIFASMGLFNLCENGEMVYIIPRSWTSGAYFKRFREYFLTEGKPTVFYATTYLPFETESYDFTLRQWQHQGR